MRYRVIDTEYGTCYIEVQMRQPFVHVDMKKWGPQAFKHVEKQLEVLQNLLYLGGARYLFCQVEQDNWKLQKFIKMFGFRLIKSYDDYLLFALTLTEPEKV